jgi:peptidyl-prolyl cis-trans isomerase SurA
MFSARIIFLSLLSFSTVYAADPLRQTAATIVAVVNRSPILQQEFAERMRVVKANFAKQKAELPSDEVLREQLMDLMITETVQLDYAQAIGLSVNDEQLNGTLERMAASNKLTVAEMQAKVEENGQPFADFREDIRKQIVFSQLRDREVNQRVQVSEAEITAALKIETQQASQGLEYLVEHILVRLPENAEASIQTTQKAKIEKAAAELQNKTAFSSVVHSYSEAPDALEGGSLGWRAASRFPSVFLNALNALQVGENTAILRSDNGFHILRLADKRSSSAASEEKIASVHARHILIKVDEVHSEAESKQRIDAIAERIKQGEDFTKLAQQFSEDGSSKNGGDLGWLERGATVPEFEQTMDTLALHTLSAPVRSQFGWHIIEVLEKKEEAPNEAQKRQKMRLALRERKADQTYENWVQELRSSAYIDKRIDHIITQQMIDFHQ